MVLACVYLLAATCCIENQNQKRDYYGVYKVNANQTPVTAASCRLKYHISHPVSWMKHALPETMSITPLGHCMTLEHALAEEAILTARAFLDGDGDVRGGPWSGPHVGSVGRSEMAKVRRLANQADDAAAARAAVLSYADTIADASPLKRHLANLKFGRDTAPFGAARKKKWSTCRKSPSGCEKRKRAGMKPGSAIFEYYKWGSDATGNRARANAKQHQKRNR